MTTMLVRLTACFGLAAIAAFGSDAVLIGDSYITTTNPAANFGAQSTMFVGGGATALVEFSFASLPVGLTSANISKATLKLFVNRVTAAGNIRAHSLASTFPEPSVTYNGFSSFILSPFSGNIALGPQQVGQFIAVDVTTQVQAGLSGGNIGFAIDGDGTVLAQLDTKESTTTAHGAVLDVTVTSFGPTGPQGPQGPAGSQGPQGPAGAAGPQGPAGASGNTVLNGTGTPANTLGNNGDFYLNTTTKCLYGPKASGAWPGSCTSLVGPTGATGAAGAAGSAGATGPQGPTGPTGATGPQGPAGAAAPTPTIAGGAAFHGQTNSASYGDPNVPSYFSVLGGGASTSVPGPAVTVTIGPSGKALVTLTSVLFETGNQPFACFMSFAISGATVRLPPSNVGGYSFGDSQLVAFGQVATQGSGTFLVTGLNAGSTTFTAKYHSIGSLGPSTCENAFSYVMVTPL